MLIFRRRANKSEMYLDLAVASRLRFCLSWCFSSCSGLNTPVVKKKKKKQNTKNRVTYVNLLVSIVPLSLPFVLAEASSKAKLIWDMVNDEREAMMCPISHDSSEFNNSVISFWIPFRAASFSPRPLAVFLC
jgi:hypothetical protein